MPLHAYDKFFGGEKGAAAKAHANMRATYGPKDGEAVFRATVAKRKRKAGQARKRKWFG
jgi:hypothetical protein